MIRLILKLVVIALVANAIWHLFGAFAPHYRLIDAVQNAAQFRGDLTDDALTAKVMLLASQYDVPITEDQVKVTHDDARTTIDISYIRPIELAPRMFRQWPFSSHIQTLNSRPPPANSPK
jgi:hypothetical protein